MYRNFCVKINKEKNKKQEKSKGIVLDGIHQDLLSAKALGILLKMQMIVQTFFLIAIGLPHGQLWAIIEEAASLTRS